MSTARKGMVDVTRKRRSKRVAEAEVRVHARPEILDRIERGDTPKGEVLPVARAAALMASKTTHLVLPHCHPLGITGAEVLVEREPGALRVLVKVTAIDRTGVEMEALYAASVAALTIYDMAKFADEDMRIEGLHLVSKQGGKSDLARAIPSRVRARVVPLQGCGEVAAAVAARLAAAGADCATTPPLAAEVERLEASLLDHCNAGDVDLLLTVGGTGLGSAGCAAEATLRVLEEPVPGLVEVARTFAWERHAPSALETGTAGIRSGVLIVNLPGESSAAATALDALLPWLFCAISGLR